MPVITLISDMGSSDHHLAGIKGSIYKQMETVNVVDVSHDVSPFNIEETAYILRSCWNDFPKGTVHVICVDDVVDLDTAQVVVKHRDHFFIGADNGLFSLLFESKPEEVFELTITQESDVSTFPSKNLYVTAACHLARGGTPEVIGRRVNGYKEISAFNPVTDSTVLKGRVLHIDAYGNAITNIKQKDFDLVRKDRDFIIISRSNNSLDVRKISASYTDVPEGKSLAIFNSTGNLEIAIRKGATGNGGGASQLFGLKVGDTVRIEFNAG